MQKKSFVSEVTGFTLIEILIVVAIIAILASVVLVGLGPTQQAGRDARRLSDLREIQTGLQLYDGKCGYFPGAPESGTTCGGYSSARGYAGMKSALTGSNLSIPTVPQDPTAGKSYLYKTSIDGTTYVLAAQLENKSNSAFTNYSPPDLSLYTDGDTMYGNGSSFSSCDAPTYCLAL